MKLQEIELVPDWKRFPKWISARTHSINAAFLTTWALLPEKFQSALPIWAVIGIAVALLVFGMVGSLIDQKPKETP